MSKIEVDAIDKQSGSTLTLGGSGTAVTLACGATQTGFGRTGTVDWQTTPKTATFTAVSGEGYFANTTGSAFNMNLPAGTAGAIVSVADYAATWDSNALTVVPNGSDKIGGVNANTILKTEGQSVTFVFVDSTQGWINTMDSTSNARGAAFVTATGGTITTSGNCKIHTFTGPGTFTVCSIGTPSTNNIVSYMVVAGGGGGGTNPSYSDSGRGGGGGAGGFREYKSPVTPYTASPLDGNPGGTSITLTATSFPITVGAGAAGGYSTNGSNSIFSTIIATGGGSGGVRNPAFPGAPGALSGTPGGSGGGGGTYSGAGAVGSGNTPPVSPAQGFNGGPGTEGSPEYGAGGGGGATAVGGTGTTSVGGVGGAGATTSISSASVTRAGGGGGAVQDSSTNAGAGGAGGGGAGAGVNGPVVTGVAGTTNTGGGGGGAGGTNFGGSGGGTGGSGIVIIRYKFQ
jgi:hypothetical protein